MMQKICIFLTSFSICFLTACSSNSSPSVVNTPSATRDSLYSNTILSPSDPAGYVALPLTKTLVDNIRAVGGEVYQAGSFVTVVLPADALFEPSTTNLLPNGEELIVDVAKIIARFPGENVVITAHTDNVGSELSQAKLTRSQAQFVAIFLWQQDDVDLKTFQRFKYAGMAGAQPITDDPSAYGESLNRRVQITIYPTQEMREAYKRLGDPDLYQI